MPTPLSSLPPLPRIPSQPRMTECEAFIGGMWRKITAEQALATNEHGGRCIHCKEPVRVHKASSDRMAAHFEHRDRNVSAR